MAGQRREDDLTLREAAAAVGLSVGTIRAHIRAGRLTPPQVTGKYGPEYRIPPAMLADFAHTRLGLELEPATLRRARQGIGAQPMAADARELYERLLTATEEATRYKALAEVSESAREAAERDYQAMLAELRYERDAERERAAAAQAAAEAEQAKAAEAAAELERLRARGFWARVFGSNG